jgi:hypothetical protein
MVLRNSLLGTDVTEHVQLLLVFSTHAFFLSGCAVEQESFLVEYASKTKEQPPDSIRIIECSLRLQTLMTPTVSKPRCANFLEMSG